RMIVVFMSYENDVDAVRIFTYRRQPFRNLLPAHTGINQQPHYTGLNERRVSAASASKNTDCHGHTWTMSDAEDRTGEYGPQTHVNEGFKCVKMPVCTSAPERSCSFCLLDVLPAISSTRRPRASALLGSSTSARLLPNLRSKTRMATPSSSVIIA